MNAALSEANNFVDCIDLVKTQHPLPVLPPSADVALGGEAAEPGCLVLGPWLTGSFFRITGIETMIQNIFIMINEINKIQSPTLEWKRQW